MSGKQWIEDEQQYEGKLRVTFQGQTKYELHCKVTQVMVEIQSLTRSEIDCLYCYRDFCDCPSTIKTETFKVKDLIPRVRPFFFNFDIRY